ncbi:MAG: metal ABC transporter ATP-binding protein [Bacteroidia bacterium]|nr:metal ABC transporter ATP-binding protein [Bacteroidia bacterium]
MDPVIKVEGLSVSYDRKRVLTNVYLDLHAGNTYGVIGPNGAGKSTLFKAILGLLEINTGKIRVEGSTIDQKKKKLAYIPQRNEVDWSFPAIVMDIVLMGRYPHKNLFQKLNSLDYEIANDAMEELGILNLKNRQISELSGGQQQRVFIARALCQQAEIFLFDEPFVGVDMTTEDRIIKVLQRLAEEGKTLLVVHHDLSTVEAYFDHCILLNQRLIAYGPTSEVFHKDNISKAYGPQLPILHKTGMIE